jgi:hypothetical protein
MKASDIFLFYKSYNWKYRQVIKNVSQFMDPYLLILLTMGSPFMLQPSNINLKNEVRFMFYKCYTMCTMIYFEIYAIILNYKNDFVCLKVSTEEILCLKPGMFLDNFNIIFPFIYLGHNFWICEIFGENLYFLQFFRKFKHIIC